MYLQKLFVGAKDLSSLDNTSAFSFDSSTDSLSFQSFGQLDTAKSSSDKGRRFFGSGKSLLQLVSVFKSAHPSHFVLAFKDASDFEVLSDAKSTSSTFDPWPLRIK